MFEFKDGNVVSMLLENFQTFRRMSFRFCPSFNFIAGPNGSGKSSIANAMVLVFGGTPKIIGRGKGVGEYVKFGESEARIEVGVWNRGREVKLGRWISRDNQSKYFIDGRPCRRSEYDGVVERFRGNIGNLCQFLPQEKVSEFTRLPPEGLLTEVLLAVGEFETLKGIEELGRLEMERDKLESMLSADCRRRELMEVGVKALGKDVEKINERKRKEERVRTMCEKQDWIRYKSYGDEYTLIRKAIGVLRGGVEKRSREVLDVEEKMAELKSSEAYREMDKLCKELERSDAEVAAAVEKMRGIRQDIGMVEIDKESLKAKREKRAMGVEKLKKEVLELRDEMDKLEIPAQPQELDDTKIGALEEKMSGLMRARGRIQHESSELKQRMEALDMRKKKFDEMDGIRLQMLRKYHVDTYKAVCWLRENKERFKDEIVEPPFVEVKIKDGRYALEVENFLGFQALSPFICKSSEDFEAFVRVMKDEKGWRINVVEAIRAGDPSWERREEGVSRDVLKELGFEGVLSDFIECRDEVMKYLTVAGHFDSIPVCKGDVDESLVFRKTNIRRMAARGRYIEIKKSKYGEEHVVIYNPLKPRGLFSQSLSREELEEIEREFEEKSQKRRENEERLKKILGESEVVDRELQVLYKEKGVYNSQMMEIKRKKMQLQVLKKSIDRKESEICMLEDTKDLESDERRLEQTRAELEVAWRDGCNELKMHLSDAGYFDVFRGADRAFREVIGVNKSVELLEESKRVAQEVRGKLEEEIGEKKKESARIKKAMEKKRAELERIDRTEEYDEILSQLPNTIEELDDEIAKEKAQLKFYNVDGRVLGEFETKEQDLRAVEEAISKRSQELEEIKGKGLGMRGVLAERVQGMTRAIDERFRGLFAKAGWNGKVVFASEGLDACKWRLNIMVKFRDDDDLEALNSYRQSGGEKSVSIILFLLAIQSYKPSPFRLVDEINQGMDRHNEKLVHDILVALSNDGDSGQLFMITPKIAPGLTYSRAMKIIILYSSQLHARQKNLEEYKLRMVA